MNIQEIKDNLTTNFLGQNIIYFDEIGSTQEEAKRLAENDIANGSMVLTDMQTAGIGTHGRTWYTSTNKNISMTLVLYPNCNINKLKEITIEIAEGIVDVIWNLYKINLGMKSPNDLILNDKKIGGILTETKVDRGIVRNLFIGIGLNVNEEDFPEDIAGIAASLKKEFKKDFKREIIIAGICNKLENVILKTR